MSNYITVYTKEPETFYPNGLARSIHFQADINGNKQELNKGYGILFARGVVNAQDVIEAKALCSPRIWKNADDTYTISAIRTKESGEKDAEPVFLSWTTKDFIEFEEKPSSAEPAGYLQSSSDIEIPPELLDAAIAYWNPAPGKSLISFPKAKGFGDPVFFAWEGKWYFLSTNDNVDDIGLYIRVADSVPELVEDTTPLHLILDKDEEKGFIQTFWAPEAHVIGQDLYILLAIGGKVWGPCCYSMKLKKGCNPVLASSWEEPRPMRRKDGSLLTRPIGTLTEEEKKSLPPTGMRSSDNRYGISLDMTYFEAAGRSYVVWSYRTGLGSPLDTGSMLMIGEIDPSKPDQLITEPVLISRPLYGYENTCGTINNEGPFVYKKNGMIHIFYSGGDARGYLYTINVLSAPEDAALLCADTWKKRITPIGNFTTWPGKYGPGHNSYFTDEDGNDWIAFHCVQAPGERTIAVAVEEMPHF